MITETIYEKLDSLRRREEATWAMAQVYVTIRDAHGVMDIGAELQALQRARAELEALLK